MQLDIEDCHVHLIMAGLMTMDAEGVMMFAPKYSRGEDAPQSETIWANEEDLVEQLYKLAPDVVNQYESLTSYQSLKTKGRI